MRSHQPARRFTMPALLGVSIAALAACSSSGSTGASAPTTSAPAASASATGSSSSGNSGNSAAIGQITANWQTFFSGNTPAAKKITVLQNGQSFASVINAQAGSAMAKSASAKVLSVAVNATGTQAVVKYDVLFGGQPALSGQSGVAVRQNGTWKVADSSFCALLALENNGKAPSVCSSAG